MTRLLLQILPVLAAAVLFPNARLGAADWPQWRGLNRTGISREKVSPFPAAGPSLLWTASVGTGFSSIAVTGNRLYTMGNTNEHDVVWCLEPASGRTVWAHSFSARADPQFYEGGPGATPTIAEGKVFTINKWGTVLCLDAATGSKAWQHNLWDEGIRSNRWGFAGSPLVWKDLVILNAGGAGTALDRANGRTIWFNGTDPAGYASPALVKIAGREVVLIFAAKDLVAVDPRTGQEFWRHRFETGYDTNNTDPIVDGDLVFLSSYSRGCELLRVSADKAELIYAKDVLHNHLSPGILLGDYLYSFNGEAKHETDFRCIHLPSGEIKWTTKTPAFGSLIGVGEDGLLILSEKGELTLAGASPSEFKPLSRAQVMGGVCWTPPTLANGRIYARNAKGDLKCFQIEK
jgi:outer membrane protein assembly factor BamB